MPSARGYPPAVITAAFSVAILIGAFGSQLGAFTASEKAEQQALGFERRDTAPMIDTAEAPRDWRGELASLGLIATTTAAGRQADSHDALAQIGEIIADGVLNSYSSLKQYDAYTRERASNAGRSMGKSIRAPLSYTLHGEHEFTLDTDVSKEGMLRYRADMQTALKPLVTEAEPEFATFARYIETKNPERLNELKMAAEQYRSAEAAALKVSVPRDAAAQHLRAVNAIGAYAVMIDELVRFADSPLTVLTLLRTQNETERELIYAFDALSEYYVKKNKGT